MPPTTPPSSSPPASNPAIASSHHLRAPFSLFSGIKPSHRPSDPSPAATTPSSSSRPSPSSPANPPDAVAQAPPPAGHPLSPPDPAPSLKISVARRPPSKHPQSATAKTRASPPLASLLTTVPHAGPSSSFPFISGGKPADRRLHLGRRPPSRGLVSALAGHLLVELTATSTVPGRLVASAFIFPIPRTSSAPAASLHANL